MGFKYKIKSNLLITNNIENDSIHDALKNYAAAELLAYQKNTSKAIDTLNILLNKYKGHPIEDEALFKQAELYTANQNYSNAEANYLKIIEIDALGVLVDDSYYMLAELYAVHLDDSEKAKEMLSSLEKSIASWEDINEKLGNVISGLKGACFATSAILTIKNLMDGASGESLSRGIIMTNSGGWNDKCCRTNRANR